MTRSAVPQPANIRDVGARQSGAKNFRSIVVGRFFSALSIWLALVALTKMSDPATVGMYALAQAICIPIAEVAKMGLREVRSSDTDAFFAFGDYLGLRLLAALCAFVLMLVAGFLQSGFGVIFLIIAVYALARCAELVSDMMYGLFQAHERMQYIGRSLCLLGPLSLLFLVAGYWFTGSLLIAVMGQLFAHLGVLTFYDLPLGRYRARAVADVFQPRWDFSVLFALARRAIPLTIATLLIIVALYFPRIAVENELGLTGLGLFAAILALAMAPDRLVNAMGVAASIRLANHFAAGRFKQFNRLLSSLAFGVAFCGLVGLAISAQYGEAILRFVYSEAYASQHELLIWLVAAAVLRAVSSILGYGLVAMRRFWWLGFQNGAAALIAVAACLLLIPRFGLSGAGAAMTIIFATQLIIVLTALAYALKVAEKPEVTT